MNIPTMKGIRPEKVTTSRLTTRVLFSGPDDAEPVLFLHGNHSSATWFEEVMNTLPAGFRGIAPDLRGYGESETGKKIDATRGLGDLADDTVALLDHLELEKVHIVGNSMGGNVIWRLLIECPERFRTVTQVDPGSPFGFGGTKDIQGTPCYDDYAGSGAGLLNPELVKLVRAGDRSLDSQFSPRAALRNFVFKPPNVPKREEELLSAMLSIHLGERDYPGDKVPSPNWPFVAPGKWGINNALSPKYADDVEEIIATDPKPDILWIRGSHDLAVSDNAASDPGTLGAMGLIPGWPGPEVFPSQPMLKQIRAVLDSYANNGGFYEEVVINDAGHAPYLDQLEAFNQLFHRHINR